MIVDINSSLANQHIAIMKPEIMQPYHNMITVDITDASGLKEPEHVRDSQEKVVQGLQQYTTAQYPSLPSKFGELLLRMPELHRVCQVSNDMFYL